MTDKERVDFDTYADRYEKLMDDQLAFFSKDHGYFAEYKVRLVAAELAHVPRKILDFGCGIGLSLPYLRRYFPTAEIHATDLSGKSLDYVRERHPDVKVLADDAIDTHTFDLIFIANVFHHIPVEHREEVSLRLARLLERDGELFIFDHNPFNPVTRHMVNTCPFDEDAVLLRRSEMKFLVRDVAKLTLTRSRYCLYFPQSLAALQPLEGWLGWLPLGGQYFVSARK